MATIPRVLLRTNENASPYVRYGYLRRAARGCLQQHTSLVSSIGQSCFSAAQDQGRANEHESSSGTQQ
jgi:hypothetical protein